MTQEEFSAGIDAQLHWIGEARVSLHQEARVAVDDYWAHHYKGNGDLDVWERSKLGVRVRTSKEGDFYIQWYWNKWIKDKAGKRRPLSQYIRKGKGFAYPESVLRKLAKEWELDLVLDLERDFAVIRQKVRDGDGAAPAANCLPRGRSLRRRGDRGFSRMSRHGRCVRSGRRRSLRCMALWTPAVRLW